MWKIQAHSDWECYESEHSKVVQNSELGDSKWVALDVYRDKIPCQLNVPLR